MWDLIVFVFSAIAISWLVGCFVGFFLVMTGYLK